MQPEKDTETLRQQLLDELWGGACSGLGAMLVDEQAVLQADPEELRALARRYGLGKD